MSYGYISDTSYGGTNIIMEEGGTIYGRRGRNFYGGRKVYISMGGENRAVMERTVACLLSLTKCPLQLETPWFSMDYFH